MPGTRILKFATTAEAKEAQGKQRACIRILLADDNSEILDRICEMLQPEYEVIGKIADGNSLCSAVFGLNPDITILDISMGERSGIEIAQRLRERGYSREIIFLTVHEDRDFMAAAFGAGGRAYVTKPRMNEDLKPAIKAVLAHRVFVSASLTSER
jgi:DNA-binding NarL/FixJ family response regulator